MKPAPENRQKENNGTTEITERGFYMNKKEILEIRKQFTPANCAITRICGCYVDHEKEKKMESF